MPSVTGYREEFFFVMLERSEATQGGAYDYFSTINSAGYNLQ